MLKRLFIAAAIAIMIGLLFGCTGGDQALRASIAGANIDLVKAQAQAYSLPIVELEVPQASGAPLKITLRNPVANPTQVTMPDDPWARVADRAMGVAGTLGGIYLGGIAAQGIVSETGKAVQKSMSSYPDPIIIEPTPPPIGGANEQ